MSTTNYYETVIEVSEDCPVEKAEIPKLKNGERTASVIQYELLIGNPYIYTSDDVVFYVYAEKNNISKETCDWKEKNSLAKDSRA